MRKHHPDIGNLSLQLLGPSLPLPLVRFERADLAPVILDLRPVALDRAEARDLGRGMELIDWRRDAYSDPVP